MKQRLGYLVSVWSLALVFAFTGCAEKEPNFDEERSAAMGPTTYQASGTMRCSIDQPIYDDTCGYRCLHKAGGMAEIWITDISQPDVTAYRVLDFDGVGFTSRTGEIVESQKTDTARYKVVVGREHYLISHRSLTEGYKKH